MAQTGVTRRGNLPVPITRFVGRHGEILQVRRLLEESRLVTSTGVGGVGKTRLAIEVAQFVRRAFPGGMWLVDLTEVTDALQVPQAVATSLGVQDRSGGSPTDRVIDQLRGVTALIVLDNCEHLADACAAFVERLLTSTERVRVLATSRRPLGVPGEYLFAVPPLPVPDGRAASSVTALGGFDAVLLLVDRAAAIQPGFAVTEDNRLAVARLCAQVDGLPLAIELAVSRLRSLSLEQLVERLEGSFALLAKAGGAGRGRQRTLRAVMDWSYSLCSAPERMLWARLSLFVDGFDLAAAEEVCAGEDLERAEILDLLDRLVAQSIVLASPVPTATRFRLLQNISQYGRERLAEFGQVAVLTERHRDHYLGLARTSIEQWCGPGQVAILARLGQEHGNLRAALRSCLVDPAGPRKALQLTAALRHNWFTGAFSGEGLRWLEEALALPAGSDSGSVSGTDSGAGADLEEALARADALWVLVWVQLPTGEAAKALRRLEECDALATRLGDDRIAGFVACLRGIIELFTGHSDAAAAHFERAFALFELIGDTEGLLLAGFQLANALSESGDGRRAQELCRRSLALSEATGDRYFRSFTLWALGLDTWLTGDFPAAAELARDGLAFLRGFDDPVLAAALIESLAWITADQDDAAGAAQLLAAAESMCALAGTTPAAFGPLYGRHRERCRDQIKVALSPATIHSQEELGRYPRVDDAIAAILGDGDGAATAADALERPVPAGSAGPPRRLSDGPLSVREEQVAALVATGLSNRAIAAELVISHRTVDGHVERILAKLGFTTRTQVATWVAARAGQRVSPPSR